MQRLINEKIIFFKKIYIIKINNIEELKKCKICDLRLLCYSYYILLNRCEKCSGIHNRIKYVLYDR